MPEQGGGGAGPDAAASLGAVGADAGRRPAGTGDQQKRGGGASESDSCGLYQDLRSTTTETHKKENHICRV